MADYYSIRLDHGTSMDIEEHSFKQILENASQFINVAEYPEGDSSIWVNKNRIIFLTEHFEEKNSS